MVLLDTCALLWWTLDPEKLSPAAAAACEAASRQGAAISSISIWEIGIKVKKGKLALPIPFPEFVGRLKKINRLEIIPVSETIWMENLALDWDNPDPADRTIVATARRRNLPIVTKDSDMAACYDRVVW